MYELQFEDAEEEPDDVRRPTGEDGHDAEDDVEGGETGARGDHDAAATGPVAAGVRDEEGTAEGEQADDGQVELFSNLLNPLSESTDNGSTRYLKVPSYIALSENHSRIMAQSSHWFNLLIASKKY